MRYIVIIALPFVLGGCSALIGGAVGAEVADQDPHKRQYYLDTHDRPERIEEARDRTEQEAVWLYGTRGADDAVRVYFGDGIVARVSYGPQ